jgi:HK97 family phage prohead protease/HK97 family phage major capsid protein
MKVLTPFTITAADSESRTITGQIVQFDTPANASTGKVLFKSGSLIPASVKLNLEHDSARPIGKTLSMELAPDGKSINATFKISKTTAGSDAIQEAMDGLRDGFSVEANVSDHGFNEDGTMVVNQAELVGVALTHNPAFDQARVSHVAATTEETPEETPTEGDEVETTTETQEAPAVESVEASQHMIQANRPAPLFTKPRSPIVNLGTWMEHSIKAKLNPMSDSAIYVAAANDDLGTTNPAFNPTRQLNEVINALSNGTRGAIDAISRGTLPDAGLQFEIPKISQIAVVDPVAEGGAVTNTGIESSYISIPVTRFAGRNILTTEIIDRSSPDFFNELVRIMGSSMAFAQNKYVANQIKTDSNRVSGTYANTAEGLIGYVSDANVAVYSGTQRFARNILVSPAQWQNIMGYNDNGTPLFQAYFPQNQVGQVNGQSQRGLVMGLNFYVDNSGEFTGSADDSMVVLEPDAFTWYESGNFRLDVNKPSDGTVEVSLNSYGACATKVANGAQMNNV